MTHTSPDTKTFWLSFVEQDQFLGVAIVDVTIEEAAAMFTEQLDRFPNARPGAEWFGAAIRKAWQHGCNPGGQVGCADITERITPETPRYVLMQKDELRQRGFLGHEDETPSQHQGHTAD